jgi:hypothetical protein
MSDFKIPAVLEHLPPVNHLRLWLCTASAPQEKPARVCRLVPDSDGCFPRFPPQNGQNSHHFSYFEQHEF